MVNKIEILNIIEEYILPGYNSLPDAFSAGLINGDILKKIGAEYPGGVAVSVSINSLKVT